MNAQLIKKFFLWNSIINGGLLIIWIIFFIYAADWIYEIHEKIFFISRESFDQISYKLLGVYKILFLVFNLVPYLVFSLVLKRIVCTK